MDLGIKGKKAIVCASSRGLGRGCALALAEAGCDLVVNGRDSKALAATAAEIRDRFAVGVIEVAGDVSDPAMQAELIAACPAPDILVNNNGGPPRREFRDLTRQMILDGVTQNMITPIELIKAVIDGMSRARLRPHRQHHVALGLRADPRPRRLLRRAGRPHLVPGRYRPHGR